MTRTLRFCAATVFAALAVAQAAPAQIPIPIPTITLEQMILESDAIFVGEVVTTNQVRQIEELPARVSAFRVIEPLKGVKKGEVVEVKQFYPQSVPVEVGQTVLWYVEGDVRANKFSAPLHRWVAVFQIIDNDSEPGRSLVMNQLSNGTLWSRAPDGKLWNNSTFPRDVAAEYLKQYLSSDDPKLIERYLAAGDRPNVNGWLRMEFLLAATHARLSRP